jgi:hydroxymethylglutaryl-CoA reductase (NADPH)
MASENTRALHYLRKLLEIDNSQGLSDKLAPNFDKLPPRVSGGSQISPEAIARRWNLINISDDGKTALYDPSPERYQKNIEQFIGTVKVPVGLAGPLRVNGIFASGDYYVPLATTEAALVASYHRGSQVISQSGGCSTLLLSEGVSRAPGFIFSTLAEAGLFTAWAIEHLDDFRVAAESTTKHGKLEDMRVTIEGNHVYLIFDYTTGDASGQNMVTIATDAVCQYIIANSPVAPRHYFVEANLSGDKKASAQSYLSVRGRKVSAEVVVPAHLIHRMLHTTAEKMTEYWRMSAMGGVLSGTIGVEGQFANGLTALYIACGQDAACVAESAVGVTRFEILPDESLYASVTMPNLIVGTVGGGTGLPGQQACLEILGLAGPGNARALTEVCAAVALAGEISIIGALSEGGFTNAHQRLARGKESVSHDE